MKTAVSTTSLTAAELVSKRANFTKYLQSYLIEKDIDKAFVEENITAEVIRDSFADSEVTILQPAEAQPCSSADRRSDEVTIEHLQRYLKHEGLPLSMCNQATGPHVVDSVLSAMPEELLQQYRNNQAVQSASSPVRKETTGRKGSLTSTTPSKRAHPANNADDYEDFPTEHRRASRNNYAKDRSRGIPSTKLIDAEPAPDTTLDLSQSDHTINTPELTNLEISVDSTFLTNITSQKYYAFLNGSATHNASRFASVCVTLARAGETQKAVEVGQFGLDLLDPAFLNAHVYCMRRAKKRRTACCSRRWLWLTALVTFMPIGPSLWRRGSEIW